MKLAVRLPGYCECCRNGNAVAAGTGQAHSALATPKAARLARSLIEENRGVVGPVSSVRRNQQLALLRLGNAGLDACFLEGYQDVSDSELCTAGAIYAF